MNSFLLKRYMLFFLLVFSSISVVKSQALWEVGVKGGSAFYLGDRNSTVFNAIQPTGSVYVRHNFNPRHAMSAIFGGTQFNDPFERKLVDATMQFEFNFYEFGLKNSSDWRRNFSPYIFTGISGAVYNGDRGKVVFAPNLPFGLGVKCKVFNFVNVGVEWTMHKLFNDQLDFADDPYGINASGVINNDWYSNCVLFIGFDWGDRNSYCR